MKHFSKWLCGVMAVGMLASCSNDEIVENGGNYNPDGPGYYMGVNIVTNYGGGTRSFTDGDNSSNDGIEEGYAKENHVGSLMIVLAKSSDNSFIVSSFINNDRIQNTSEKTVYLTTSKFSRDAIHAYYESGNVETEVNVFVFCNPNEPLKSTLSTTTLGDTKWVDKVAMLSNATDGSLWSTAGEGSFVMSNVEISKRQIPATEDTWNNYTTAENAFDLSGQNSQGENIDNSATAQRGTIKVHRMAARFDFKDGSANGDQTYPVMKQYNADGTEGATLLNVKLTDMSMVNMNNSMYYLERVSADGLNANSVLCGAEKPWYSDANGTPIAGSGNYVVDVYAQQKQSLLSSGFGTYMYYPFFNEDGKVGNASQWSTVKISDVLENGLADNYKEKEYKIWRYATENVIPKTDIQTNAWSTGVVFRGKIIATKAALNSTNVYVKNMAEAVNNAKADGTNPWLFKYANNLFAGWEDMRQAAVAAAYDTKTKEWNRNNGLYVTVFGNGGVGESFELRLNDGKTLTINDDLAIDSNSANAKYDAMKNAQDDATAEAAFKLSITSQGVTIYQAENGSEGWGYYCNYYYWNRHNDNNLAGIMGPMEFAVVRNNVYKLSVTQIRQLGHPIDPENDPETPTPETPDEPEDVYMKVSVEVIPWVVRVNDIIL